MIKFEVSGRALEATRADLLVVFLGKGEKLSKLMERETQAIVEADVAREKFDGAKDAVLSVPLGSGASRRNVLLIGLGPKGDLSAERWRYAAAIAGRRALSLNAKKLAVALPAGSPSELGEITCGVALGLSMAFYRFQRYLTDEKKHVTPPQRVTLCTARGVDTAGSGLEKALALAEGLSIARDLVNEPAATMTPTALAAEARRIGRRHGLRVKIMSRPELERQRMGALLAVARGSDSPPCVGHLIYKPRRKARARLVFVGKGVTFDSGGYDIKGAEHMLDMKMDMAGAAAVIGAMATIATLAPQVEVHGIFGAVENMISGRAYKPGDVLRSRRGTTIEINNTDAEGRLVLADLLDYVCTELQPDLIVDLATLTGACVVALGPQISAVMSPSAQSREAVLTASQRAGERMWPLPLPEDYMDQLKSSIADLRNTGTRYGGALTAGLFLKQFVHDGIDWVHLDIAGPAFYDVDHPFWSKGGTGAGVGTLTELALSY